MTLTRLVGGQAQPSRQSRAPRRLTSWLALVMSVAACGGDEGHHGTTVVPPDLGRSVVTDAGDPSDAAVPVQRCRIDAPYLADHKSCSVDADCVSLSYRPTCCANTLLVGVSKLSFAAVSECAAQAPLACACEATPNRAEDGRAILGGVSTTTHCVAGRCQTSVTERLCGGKITCKPDEICVSYGDAPSGGTPDGSVGDNAYEVFACQPNPCTAELDCQCAQAACDTGGKGTRKCEVARNDQSDVACVPYGD